MFPLASTMMFYKIHIFLWNFSLFWKSCRTLNDIILPWVALMSWSLIFNNNDPVGFCHFNFNWKYQFWPLQCCCEIHIFLWNFSLFWKSCRTLNDITLPWVALMSCPLIYNNNGLGGFCHSNFDWKCYLWLLHWCFTKFTYFCRIFLFFENRVGLHRL